MLRAIPTALTRITARRPGLPRAPLRLWATTVDAKPTLTNDESTKDVADESVSADITYETVVRGVAQNIFYSVIDNLSSIDNTEFHNSSNQVFGRINKRSLGIDNNLPFETGVVKLRMPCLERTR